MERATLERDEPLVHERCAAVDELCSLGAVVERALAHAPDVGLVVLTEIGRESVRDTALLADPRDGDGGVEAAGERDPDSLSDGKRLEDTAHAGSLATARCWGRPEQ